MKLSEMITLVNLYIDDIEENSNIILMLNAAKNNMGIEVKADFPDIVATSSMDETFVFDAKYHETPVLYAAAMLKAKDSAVREKESYIGQYMRGIQNFSENYDPPVQYLSLPNVQHFTATLSQTDFVITKNWYSPRYGNLRVYRNSLETTDFTTYDHTISLLSPATAGEIISAVWEIDSDYVYTPAFYPNWG